MTYRLVHEVNDAGVHSVRIQRELPPIPTEVLLSWSSYADSNPDEVSVLMPGQAVRFSIPLHQLLVFADTVQMARGQIADLGAKL